MNICIPVPSATLRIKCEATECIDQPSAIVKIERNWHHAVVDHVITIGAVAAQSVAAFTGRYKQDGRGASIEAARVAAFLLPAG